MSEPFQVTATRIRCDCGIESDVFSMGALPIPAEHLPFSQLVQVDGEGRGLAVADADSRYTCPGCHKESYAVFVMTN
jgi:hypothetical protein